MIIGDNRKPIETIMAKRSPKDGTVSSSPMKKEVMKSEDGEMDGRHMAAQDMIMAFHEKSPEKLMEALSNFMDMHNMRGEVDSEEEQEA